MGLNMKKSVMFTIRGCFRSICNHPFLVFLLCVLTYICRSSPFMFSLLLYVSPVLVCTAVLLGTLLYFGQHNAPRIEMKETTTNETARAKPELSKDSILVEKEKNNVDEICREDRVDVHPLSRKMSREFGEEHKDERNDERSLSDEKVMMNCEDDNLESEYEKSEAESYDSEMVAMDSLESQSHSAWKQSKHGDEDEEEDALDSEFDGAESSSPDASMPDMMPMLDELHPLLDEEASQLVQMSRAVSEAPSERYSPRSSIESVDETENPEDSEVPDEDEDAQNDKEEQAAIAWTEEDKRNLMNVGSSEIERNKRLENLILRRRSWKNTSMVPEINLIDLESSDFPYHMMHISTTRHNPFELPHDSDIHSGLPPVPSSAPPVLVPRKNPFDVPCHQPSMVGDLKTAHISREPFFRPYLVPEVAMVSEEATTQRASSESSVAETDSGSSAEEEQKAEEEDKGLSEDEEAEVPPNHESQSSEGEECLELGSGEKEEEEKFEEYNSCSETSERERSNSEDELSRQASDVSDLVSNKEPVYDLSPTAESSGVPKISVLESIRTGGGGGEADEVVTPSSDDDYVEANDKLISTPSAGGTTSHLIDRLLHEHKFKQVQVSNSPAGDLHSASSVSRADIDETKIIDRRLSELDSVEVKLDRDKEKRCKKSDCSIEPNSSENKQVMMISVKRRLSTPF